jgi:tRNA-splicing ligase RtcB
MPYIEIPGGNVPIKIWLPLEDIEEHSLAQLRNVAALPWTAFHVAAMPDCHAGKGATVGSVIAMRGAVAPSAVGVDLGCGVLAARTNITASGLPDNLKEVRHQIERDIPSGFNEHDDEVASNLRLPVETREAVRSLLDDFSSLALGRDQRMQNKAWKQIGTLGGGNHFIEMAVDDQQRVWVTLHSGSRYLGNKLAEYHIDEAMRLPHNKDLPDRTLAVLIEGTPQFDAYWHDLQWAQRYAWLNRDAMLELIFHGMRRRFFRDLVIDEVIRCHHNFASIESHFGEKLVVTRKGAIIASDGERGVIPGSMGGKTYIVAGLGNPDSFNSAAHGAGRRMSRGEAKRTFNAEDVRQQTEGVECRKDKGVVDEIPSAYKDIEVVMANQVDLVRPTITLKGVLVVKDSKA